MQLVVLVGGRGTRLGELVSERPKPLLQVAGRPFVEHLLINAARFGFSSFVLLAGYRADDVMAAYGPGSAFASEFSGKIDVVAEKDPSGTAGALLSAADYLHARFVLMNGDSFFDFNLLDLTCPDLAKGEVGRIALRHVDNADRYGSVTQADGLIVSFNEKSAQAKAGMINAGVYYLSREIVDWIAATPSSLERDVFPKLVEACRLGGRSYSGYFIDIGIPSDLSLADKTLAQCLKRPALFLDRDGTLNHDAGYTHRPEQFEWIEGAPEAIKRANDAGILVFVVSNQAGIARGYYGEGAVKDLHSWMNAQLLRIGAHIDEFRFCPHHPDGIVPGLAVACNCRKPHPTMVEELLVRYSVDRTRALMIGDKDTDAMCGVAAGIRGARVEAGQLADVVGEFIQQVKP